MQLKTLNLPKARKEFHFEITPEEFKPFLEQAAKALSEGGKIPGFRPGHAPYEMAAKHFGEMAIYEAAGEKAIPRFLDQAIQEEKIEVASQPQIEIEKLAPGNPFVFKAVVSLMPGAKLGDWVKLKFKRKPADIKNEQIEQVIEEARKMRAAEAVVARPAQKSDKMIIDMEINQDKVPVEGGQAKDHAVYLDENYYIPGLPEQLLGLKKGDLKEFSLAFPATHYQKHLAGKKADFKVTIKDVFERTLPALDDNLAQGLGQKTLADLRNLIADNLKLEAGQKEEQRLEIEILGNLVKKSEFSEIPEILIEAEKRKMFDELKGRLAEMGINFEDYLKNLKKTEEEMAKDFERGAGERIKSALVIRELARQNNIFCPPEELKEEIKRLRELYKDNPKTDERLNDSNIQDYVASMLVNRKVMKMLKEKVVE